MNHEILNEKKKQPKLQPLQIEYITRDCAWKYSAGCDAPHGYVVLDYKYSPFKLEAEGAYVVNNEKSRDGDKRYDVSTHNPKIYTWWLLGEEDLYFLDEEGINHCDDTNDTGDIHDEHDEYDEYDEYDECDDEPVDYCDESGTLAFITKIYTDKKHPKISNFYKKEIRGISLSGYFNCGMLIVRGLDKEGNSHLFATHMEPGLFLSGIEDVFFDQVGFKQDAAELWTNITMGLHTGGDYSEKMLAFSKAFNNRLRDLREICGDAIDISFAGSNEHAVLWQYYELFLQGVATMVKKSGYKKEIPIVVGPNTGGGPTTFNIPFDGTRIEVIRDSNDRDITPQMSIQSFLQDKDLLTERLRRVLTYAKSIVRMNEEERPDNWDSSVKLGLIRAHILFHQIELYADTVDMETKRTYYDMWMEVARALFEEEEKYLQNHLFNRKPRKYPFLLETKNMPVIQPEVYFNTDYKKELSHYKSRDEIIYLSPRSSVKDLQKYGYVGSRYIKKKSLPYPRQEYEYWVNHKMDNNIFTDKEREHEGAEKHVSSYVTEITSEDILLEDMFSDDPVLIFMGKKESDEKWLSFVAGIKIDDIHHLLHEALHEIYDPLGAEEIWKKYTYAGVDGHIKFNDVQYKSFQSALEERLGTLVKQVGLENISLYISPGSIHTLNDHMTEAFCKATAHMAQQAGFTNDINVLGAPDREYRSHVMVRSNGTITYSRPKHIDIGNNHVFPVSIFDDPKQAHIRFLVMKREAEYYIAQFKGTESEDGYFGNKEKYLFAIREAYVATEILRKHNQLSESDFKEITLLANEGVKLLWFNRERDRGVHKEMSAKLMNGNT